MAVRSNHSKANKKRRVITKERLRINVPVQLRTLKRSARKQLDKERAPSLWVLPWHESNQLGVGRVYPLASLLGLPSELRHKILYRSYRVEELKAEAKATYAKKPGRAKRAMASGGQQRLDCELLAKFNLTTREGELVATLSTKVGILCRTSPLIRQDMEYICKWWQEDLEELLGRDLAFHLHRPKFPKVPEEMEWLHTPSIAVALRAEGEGNVIKGKQRGGKRKRPQKCWYCTERHYGIDPVCPMVREDPNKWKEMTRKLGGRRGGKAAKTTAESRKIIFDDA